MLRALHLGRSLAGRSIMAAAAAAAAAPSSRAARLLVLRASVSSTTGGTTTPGANVPVWPPPRSRLAKMYEDEEDDLNSDDPERRAAAGKRRARQLAGEAQEGEDGSYLDDHHYVPGAGGQSASLSPHHEGYDEGAARRLRQRLVIVERGHDDPTGRDRVDGHSSDDSDDGKSKGGSAVSGFGGKPGGVGGGGSGGRGANAAGGSGGGGGGGGGGPAWSWAQPQGERVARGPGGQRVGALVSIPVKSRTLLSAAEVVGAMEALGGREVAVVDVRGKGQLDVEAMVFVSGRSGAHLRRMADTLVLALKQRQIGEREAPGVTGAEGYDCDDWMIVDGGNLVVHLMDPRQRKALALEAHWSQSQAELAAIAALPAARSEAAWDAAHDRALQANPPDDEYDPWRDDHASRERAFRRLVQGGGKGTAGGRLRVRGGAAGRK